MKTQNSAVGQVFIPAELSELLKDAAELRATLKELSGILGSRLNPEGQIGKYITEERAKEIIGKSTTWFYYQRKDGSLNGYKLGGKNMYLLSDIENLVERGQAA